MKFARRDFASWALGTLGAAVACAAPRSARAEESTDRAGRLQASNEVLRIQRSLRKAKDRIENTEMPIQVRHNVLASIREAEEALREAQGFLTQGKSEE